MRDRQARTGYGQAYGLIAGLNNSASNGVDRSQNRAHPVSKTLHQTPHKLLTLRKASLNIFAFRQPDPCARLATRNPRARVPSPSSRLRNRYGYVGIAPVLRKVIPNEICMNPGPFLVLQHAQSREGLAESAGRIIIECMAKDLVKRRSLSKEHR